MAGEGDKRAAGNVAADSTLGSGGSESTLQAPSPPKLGSPEPPKETERYSVENEFARGGLGRVLRARDNRLARTVAIKQLLTDDQDARARFEREAMITARLQHPSIVPIYDMGRQSNGEPYYAMKLISGRALDGLIRERTTLAGRLALLPNMIAVAEAVAYAHSERVIHRDLKPANIIVGEFGETIVIDWGLAKDLLASESVEGSPMASPGVAPAATAEGAVVGTPLYMPPEQARGEKLDERSDVYSLGAVLYHLLAGRAPYEGPTAAAVLAQLLSDPPRDLAAIQPDVPRDLQAIAAKAMSREPGPRYRTAKEFAEELKRFQTGQLVAAHSYSFSELLRRWIRKHRAAVSIGAAAIAVVSALAAGTGVQLAAVRRRARETAQQQRTVNQVQIATRLAIEEVQALRDAAIQLAATPEIAAAIINTDSAATDLISARTRAAPPSLAQLFDQGGNARMQHPVNLASRWASAVSLVGTDPIVKRTLRYERVVTISVIADSLVVRATAPIVDNAYRLRGAVVLSAPMDGKFANRIRRSLTSSEVLLHAGRSPGYASFLYASGDDTPKVALPQEVAAGEVHALKYLPRAVVNGRECSVAYSALHGANGEPAGLLGVAVERGRQ